MNPILKEAPFLLSPSLVNSQKQKPSCEGGIGCIKGRNVVDFTHKNPMIKSFEALPLTDQIYHKKEGERLDEQNDKNDNWRALKKGGESNLPDAPPNSASSVLKSVETFDWINRGKFNLSDPLNCEDDWDDLDPDTVISKRLKKLEELEKNDLNTRLLNLKDILTQFGEESENHKRLAIEQLRGALQVLVPREKSTDPQEIQNNFGLAFDQIWDVVLGCLDKISHERLTTSKMSNKKNGDREPLLIPFDFLANTSSDILRLLLEIQRQGNMISKGQEKREELKKLVDKYLKIESKIIFLQEMNRQPDLMDSDPRLATKVHQVLHDFAQQAIQEENHLLAFELESHLAQVIPLSGDNPFFHMSEAIEKGTGMQLNPKLGAYFSSLGGLSLKGGHLHANKRSIEGQEIYCFDFKINHYARNELGLYLDAVKANIENFKDSLPENLKTTFKIDEENHFHAFFGFDPIQNCLVSEGLYNPFKSNGIVFSFGQLGKIIIGSNSRNGSMYNTIKVEIQVTDRPDEELRLLHSILCVSGIGPILGQQLCDADEKLKIAQLLRAFDPKTGNILDHTKEFYELSIEQLKLKIVELNPEMKNILEKYLEKSPELMQKIEILPGREIWGVMDLSTLMKNNGAWGLMSGIESDDWESTKKSIGSVLKEGVLSCELRFHKGDVKKGTSTSTDFQTGGADQVFCRLVNNHLIDKAIATYPYCGFVQLLWNLDTVVPRVPYGHYQDAFGVKSRYHRNYSLYRERSSLIDFSRNVSSVDNEVMVKNAIDPSHIAGIVVNVDSHKQELIDHLLKEGLAKENALGQICINIAGKTIAADHFIHVQNHNLPFLKRWWGH